MDQGFIQWIGYSVEIVKGETSLSVATTKAQEWSYDWVSCISGKTMHTNYLKVSNFGLQPVQVNSDKTSEWINSYKMKESLGMGSHQSMS
jgi:hypothetical protein